MRMKTPCRGMACKHNQCFDATSYLQLQEQAPQWECPQCNKSVPWDQLVIDHYILDILKNTSADTEQVTVEPDGQWHLGQTHSSTPATGSRKRKADATPDFDDDDDLVVLDDFELPKTNGTAVSSTLTPSSVRTPPVNARESSAAMSQRSASKRPRQEVIDLTLSDDEDDQEARPAVKRTSTNQTSSLPGLSSMAAFRPRPPDAAASPPNRYQFTLPPPNSLPSFNFSSSFGTNGDFNGGFGGYNTTNGGNNGSTF
jgi:E3 SUMO-protein ligase PIAS1